MKKLKKKFKLKKISCLPAGGARLPAGGARVPARHTKMPWLEPCEPQNLESAQR
jgi:hypothetical protein